MEMANVGCNVGPLALPGCSIPGVTCRVATPSAVPHFGRRDLLTREDSPLLPIHGLVLVSLPPSLALVRNDSRKFRHVYTFAHSWHWAYERAKRATASMNRCTSVESYHLMMHG